MDWGDRIYDLLMHPLEALIFRRLRRALIPRARGRVLEIGAGTGANLPHYRWERIDEMHLLDLALSAQSLAARSRAPVRLHEADAQSLPFADGTFDTVVCTLVFCSVADQARALSEVRRVLKSDGMLIFIEHVRPGRGGLARIADAANPLWHRMIGTCNLNRDTVAAVREAGFAVRDGRVDGMIAAGIGRPVAAP